MTDIIVRLRAPFAVTEQDAQEAVAEITRLRARSACLQAECNALKEELQKDFNAMRVFARYRELETEIENLREENEKLKKGSEQ